MRSLRLKEVRVKEPKYCTEYNVDRELVKLRMGATVIGADLCRCTICTMWSQLRSLFLRGAKRMVLQSPKREVGRA